MNIQSVKGCFKLLFLFATSVVCGTPAVLLANEPPALKVDPLTVDAGSLVEFVVAPTDPDGVVPDVYLLDSPNGANLQDNGDGTRTFSWLPVEPGMHPIEFEIRDGQDKSITRRVESDIEVLGAKLKDSADAAAIGHSSTDDQPQERAISNANQEFNASIQIGQQPGDVEVIVSDLPVSFAQANVQQTSMDTWQGYLYTVNIEPGPDGDVHGDSLHTVLRQGRQRGSGGWEWKKKVINDRTVHNRWHTAPSVAVDKSGKVHVVYNMHNIPWQYKRSTSAHNIDDFTFEGQQTSTEQIRNAWKNGKTNFPTLGSAAIPGNQITYPSFYKDNNNDLYITYRFAAAPARKFADRMMSSGIAVYNNVLNTWTAIGKSIQHNEGDFQSDAKSPSSAKPIAGATGWTSYIPRLVFDNSNNMLVSSMWRQGIAGTIVQRPCVFRTRDRNSATDLAGKSIALPATPWNCNNVGISNDDRFYNIGSFAIDNNDVPVLLLSPEDGSRFLLSFNQSENRWVKETAPGSATEIFFDDANNMYAIASGIRIYKRASGSDVWQQIYDEGSKKNCTPKVKKDADGKIAFIHTLSCDGDKVSLYGLRLR